MGNWAALEKPGDVSADGFLIGPCEVFVEAWSGTFYAPNLEREGWIEFFSEYFAFAELDCSLKHRPKGYFEDVARKSCGSLVFGVKVPRDVTAPGDPVRGRKRLDELLACLGPLIEQGRLYSLLFQVGSETPKSIDNLSYLLRVAHRATQNRLSVHFEFRSRSWHCAQVLSRMRDSGIGIANAEVGDGHAFPFRPYTTTERGYMRFLGKRFSGWRVPKWRRTQRGREEEKAKQFDYLYSEAEIEEHVDLQFTLQAKTSQIGIAYANLPKSQAVVNAIQNIRQIRTRLDVLRLCSDHPVRQGVGSGMRKAT